MHSTYFMYKNEFIDFNSEFFFNLSLGIYFQNRDAVNSELSKYRKFRSQIVTV